MEDDFVSAHHSELVTRDALDGRRVVAQPPHFHAKAGHIACELLVFRVHLVELLLQSSETRQPVGGQDEHRDRDDREHEDRDRERSLDEGCGEGQGRPSFPRPRATA